MKNIFYGYLLEYNIHVSVKKVNSVVENEDKSTNMVLRQVNNIDDDTGGGSNDDNRSGGDDNGSEDGGEEEGKGEEKMKKVVVVVIILLHYTVRCQPLVSSKCLGTQKTRHSSDNNTNINTGRVYS
jgi:hypothetical protein